MIIKDSEFDNGDFSLVELKEGAGRLTPHCKKHGAMNKFADNIWRCITQYGREDPKDGETIGRFIDRTCDACCIEI